MEDINHDIDDEYSDRDWDTESDATVSEGELEWVADGPPGRLNYLPLQESDEFFWRTKKFLAEVEQEDYSYSNDSDPDYRPGDEVEDEEVDGGDDTEDVAEDVEDNAKYVEVDVEEDVEDEKKTEKDTVDKSSTKSEAIEGGDMKPGKSKLSLASSCSKDEYNGKEIEMMDLRTRVKELEAANILKDILLKDKERDFETIETENVKWNKIVEEMRGRVECQVCLILPKQGPVPMCPNGHFICTACKARNRQEGKVNCPTCQEPLGEIKSLLAKTVIENVKHECDHEGCEEMIPHNEYEKHQESCDFRLVLCPGSGRTCRKLVAFCDLEIHTSDCQDMLKGLWTIQEKGLVHTYTISEKLVATENEVSWGTKTIKQDSLTFFLRLRKLANTYQAEVVMEGSESDCHLFTTEISILYHESEEAVFKTCFHPRPINTKKWGTFCMLVPQDALANIWKPMKGEQKNFKLAVKIHKSNKKL